jgi:hypothetical protein
MNGPFGLGFGATAEVSPEDPATEDGPNASLVAQLEGLYQEKQELEAALGVSTSSEVIELITARQSDSMLGSLTDQLIAVYTEREELRAEIGCSSTEDIIALVTSLRGSLRTLVDDSRRRLDFEASLLQSHERFLS